MKKQSQNSAKECSSMPPRGLSCLLAQHCALKWPCAGCAMLSKDQHRPYAGILYRSNKLNVNLYLL